jgi:hypothetical protein
MKPRIEIQSRERHTKRTMWFRGQSVPILYGQDRKDIFGSEYWVARGTIQKIGTIILAAVFFCASVALFVASRSIRAEVSESVNGVPGQLFGTGLAVFAVVVALCGMFLTVRLVRGIFRSFYK